MYVVKISTRASVSSERQQANENLVTSRRRTFTRNVKVLLIFFRQLYILHTAAPIVCSFMFATSSTNSCRKSPRRLQGEAERVLFLGTVVFSSVQASMIELSQLWRRKILKVRRAEKQGEVACYPSEFQKCNFLHLLTPN